MFVKNTACVLALVSIATATSMTTVYAPTRTLQERAIVPTASGQIGINPVEDDIGDPSIFVGTISGTDTLFVQNSDATTLWMVPDQNFLTVTTTAGSTSTIQVIVATATAATNGQSVGDISVLLPEALANSLHDAASAAVSSCNVAAVKVKRDGVYRRDAADAALSCLLTAAQNHANPGGLFDVVDPAVWDGFKAELAQAAPQLLNNAWQLAKTQALRNKLTLFMIVCAIVIGGTASGPVAKINIPAAGIGAIPKGNGGGTDTNTKCPPDMQKGKESPVCPDTNCLGEPQGTCTVGSLKGCPCLHVMTPMLDQYDSQWFAKQQQILQSVLNSSPVNKAGTRVNVNKGCIYINDSQRCQGGDAYNVADQGQDNSTATIYAKLPSDTTSKQTAPGCIIQAQWPRFYGDVYYGADDCIYDSFGNNIFGQCCKDKPTDGKMFDNPYFQQPTTSQPPPTTTQSAPQPTQSSQDGVVTDPILPTDNSSEHADCLDRPDGSGTRISGTAEWDEGSAIVMGQRLTDDIEISTKDTSACVSHGQTKNKDGAILSNWCMVAQNGGVAFVIADKAPQWGGDAVGWSTIKGSDMITFSKWSAANCQGDNKATVVNGGSRDSVGGGSLNSLCILDQDHPEFCAS